MSDLRLDQFESVDEFFEALKTERRGYSTQHYISAITVAVCMALAFLIISACVVWGADVDMEKIIRIESNGNPHAYNSRSGAIGLCQITPICLTEFNIFQNKYKFTAKDLYVSWCNIEVGDWYMNKRIPHLLRNYGLKDTITNRLRAYNEGIGNLNKGRYPKETREYVKKYFMEVE